MHAKNLISNPIWRRCNREKIRITRKNKREAFEKLKLTFELWGIIKHYFPDLIPKLREGHDPRHQSYTEYANHLVLLTRLIGAVFYIGSMRKLTSELNRKICFKNISVMLGLDEELSEIPHWKTINDFLKKLDTDVLEQIIPKLVVRLTRMRAFENSRIRNKYWQIIVDATHLYTFKERHCDHCLERKFKDKNGVVVRREYYHCVLEAKLVIGGDIVISIGTEFVENESPEVNKQDCELNAFKRMAKKLKERFPRLPICLGMDSLYANDPVFKMCREYGWKYIIRFKDGSIKSVAEEFHALKGMEPTQSWEEKEGDITKAYSYVLNIPYQSHSLNIVECKQSDRVHSFVFITCMPITRKNCKQLVEDGRRRWKIENEGFNEQKNGGLNLEHLFCEDYTAIKNHYFLIQIGHMIAQILARGLKRLKSLSKISIRDLMAKVKESFRTEFLTYEDEVMVNRRRQYRQRHSTGMGTQTHRPERRRLQEILRRPVSDE